MGMHSAAMRWVLILLLVCGTAAAQAPLLTETHDHQDPSRHCCGLCHIGPLPVLTASTPLIVAPDLPLERFVCAEDSGDSHDAVRIHTPSRAPPR
jgi:hypothetical protein